MTPRALRSGRAEGSGGGNQAGRREQPPSTGGGGAALALSLCWGQGTSRTDPGERHGLGGQDI